ncbi:olfactory receptor 6N1-like [Gastrophryne carolinensis]
MLDPTRDTQFYNISHIYEVVLVGFPILHQFSILLFLAFLGIYLFIIAGNILIIFVIYHHLSLHTPMHLFIGALSCLEICYVSVTIPKMLADLLNEEKTISFAGCIMQAYAGHSLGAAECYILTIMAYDRYLAICKPLQYSSIMTVRWFVNLAVGCFIGGLLAPIIEVVMIIPLPFCGPNIIENVFCDFPPLVSLACTDTTFYMMVESCIGIFVLLLSSLSFILFSYIKIIYVIVKMKSNDGRQKAFSTCGTHLIVVILFFGSGAFIYIRVSKSSSLSSGRGVGLIYAVFTPLANPIIYGLRNMEIKKAIQSYLCQT